MSVTDITVEILEKRGEWMETSALVRKVAEERNVSERQAYRDLKRAWKDGKVRKIKLPDGVVLNGLSNWPFPRASSEGKRETLSLQNVLFYRFFKKLDEIAEDSAERSSLIAMNKISSLIHTLPPRLREQAVPHLDEVWKPFWERQRQRGGGFLDDETGAPEINYLLDIISKLLYEQLEIDENDRHDRAGNLSVHSLE